MLILLVMLEMTSCFNGHAFNNLQPRRCISGTNCGIRK